MAVIVVAVWDEEHMVVCEVYPDKSDKAYQRFEELKNIYGGHVVVLASRALLA